MEYMILNLQDEKYAIDVDCIRQILSKKEGGISKDSRPNIVGMMAWMEEVIPLISLRKALGFQTYEEEQLATIEHFKSQHTVWLEEFEKCCRTQQPFSLPLNPHQCELGLWIDQMLTCMKCNEEGFGKLLQDHLLAPHTKLHLQIKQYLTTDNRITPDSCSQKDEIEKILTDLFHALETVKKNITLLTSAFERVIVCTINGKNCGLIVDDVDQLYKVEEGQFCEQNSEELTQKGIRQVFRFEDTFVSVLGNDLLRRIGEGV